MTEEQWTFQICHRRFQQWIRSGKLEGALRLLAQHLHERGELNLEEAFVDATFASVKGGIAVGPTRRGKGTKIVAAVYQQFRRWLDTGVFEALVGDVQSILCAGRPQGSAHGGLYGQLHLAVGAGVRRARRLRRSQAAQGSKVHPMAKRGFVLLPGRWVVERSFAWAARFRCLARDSHKRSKEYTSSPSPSL